MRRLFGAFVTVQRGPIHLVKAMGLLRDPESDTVRLNLVGATSLEGLGASDRLGLKGLLLFMYPNFIL